MSEPLEREGAEAPGSERGYGSPFPPHSLSPFLPYLSVAIVALTAIWLYRRALGFAYFNDDPTGHFAWMEGQSLWQFFAGSADYGYYRPVVFAVLRLSELLFGNDTFPHNPVADHALLLLLHGANIAMVWLLARRLGGRDAFAWVAALVFAFTPFSYEAVAYVASLTHPLVVFWTLAALLLFDRGQLSRARPQMGRHLPFAARYSALALVATTLGLLTHENGLFILPALVGMDWVTRPDAVWRERARRLWPFAIPPLLFAVVWLLIPKSSEQGLNGLDQIGRNLVLFLQTLVYPLLPVIRLDSGDVRLLVLLAVGTVAILGLLAWRAGVWRPWVFAVGWVGLSSLPALLFLEPAYVYGSPRLSYLPSIGVAMLWALPMMLWTAGDRRQSADQGPRTRQDVIRGLWPVALCILYLPALILPPLPFIRCQLDFYEETSRFARGIAATAAVAPPGQEVVFVNAPFFFSSTAARPDGCPSPYPWTPVGGILIPPYAQARDFARFNGGPARAVTGVAFTGYSPGWRTFGPEIDGAALREHAANDATYVFDLLGGTFADLSAAWRPGAGASEAWRASFGGELALVDVRLVEQEKKLLTGLEWRVLAAPAAPLAAFVHVYDATGVLVAQNDGPPGGALVPQDLWQPGDGVVDERVIDVSALPPGAYTVAAGAYDTTDGVRLEVDGNGQPVVDNALVIGSFER